MANGVEEFNADKAWSRFKSGFSSPMNNKGEASYNKAPELRFTNGGQSNMGGSDYTGIHAGGENAEGKLLDPWVTRYPSSKLK